MTPEPKHTATFYECKTCGWTGTVISRPRCLMCARKRAKKWREENPDLAKAETHLWLQRRCLREPGYKAKMVKNWRSKNPLAMKRSYTQRRAWLLSGTVTSEDLKEIWNRSEGKCAYCGTAVLRPRFYPRDPRGFDHIVSRAAGGKHEAGNIVSCCYRCNSAKSASLTLRELTRNASDRKLKCEDAKDQLIQLRAAIKLAKGAE